MKKKSVIWLSAVCAVISGAALADDVSTDALFTQMRNQQLTAIGYAVNTGVVSNDEASKPVDIAKLFSAWREDQRLTDAYYALLEKEGDGWTIRRISNTAIAANDKDTRLVSVRPDATGDTIALR